MNFLCVLGHTWHFCKFIMHDFVSLTHSLARSRPLSTFFSIIFFLHIEYHPYSHFTACLNMPYQFSCTNQDVSACFLLLLCRTTHLFRDEIFHLIACEQSTAPLKNPLLKLSTICATIIEQSIV